MDEVFRLQSFRAAPVDATAARSQAAFALEQAINGKRQHPLRPTVVVIAFVIAAVLATAAYALYKEVIVGSPAPAPVQATEQVLAKVEAQLFRIGAAQHIEVGKTRAAAVLETSSGPVYLWVAPTVNGGRCAYLQIAGLDLRFAGGDPFLMQLRPGCVAPHQTQALLNYVDTGVNGHALALVVGYIPSPVKTLQLRFADGTRSRTAQTSDGFVLVQGEVSDLRPTVVLRDSRGKQITPQKPTFIVPLRVLNSPSGPSTFTITVHLHNGLGNLSLKIGPAAHGGSCSQLIFPWGSGLTIPTWAIEGYGCGPYRPKPDQIAIGRGFASNPLNFHQHIQWLKGQVGADVSSVELVLHNGSHQQVPIHHGWVLYVIDQDNPPTEIITTNKNGRVVGTRKLQPF